MLRDGVVNLYSRETSAYGDGESGLLRSIDTSGEAQCREIADSIGPRSTRMPKAY